MASNTPLPAANTPAVVTEDENNIAVDDSANISSPNRWFFGKDKLEATPSRKCGIVPDKELGYRQQSANFIQDVGHRLQLNQLCINTAIVYMHRFYMFHSFSHFNRFAICTASIFLASKVVEPPSKMERVIKVANYCLHREKQPELNVKSEKYIEQSSELLVNESILLQTLGFDLTVDHPHTHVVKCCQLVGASKELAQTSYFMATNSLYLTTMCLQYKPTVVACVCIYLACKWSNWRIPRSKEGKDWFLYVDDTVTIEQLESMTSEFLTMVNKSPSRLKKHMLSLNKESDEAKSLNSLPTAPTHLSTDTKSPKALNRPKSTSSSPADSTKRVNTKKPSESHQLIVSKVDGIPPSEAPHGIKQHESPGSSRTNKLVNPPATKPSYHQHQHGFSIYSAKESQRQLQQTTQSKYSIIHGKHPTTPHNHSHRSPLYPHNSGRPNAQSYHSHIHSGQKSLPSSSHSSNVSYPPKKIAPPPPSINPDTWTKPKPSEPGSSSRKNPTSSSGSYSPPAKKICSEVEKPIRKIERIERNPRK